MVVRLSGSVISVRPSQYQKASRPIETTPEGSSTVGRTVHPEKVSSGSALSPEGRVTEERDEQLKKRLHQISVTVSGITISESIVHSLKA